MVAGIYTNLFKFLKCVSSKRDPTVNGLTCDGAEPRRPTRRRLLSLHVLAQVPQPEAQRLTSSIGTRSPWLTQLAPTWLTLLLPVLIRLNRVLNCRRDGNRLLRHHTPHYVTPHHTISLPKPSPPHPPRHRLTSPCSSGEVSSFGNPRERERASATVQHRKGKWAWSFKLTRHELRHRHEHKTLFHSLSHFFLPLLR